MNMLMLAEITSNLDLSGIFCLAAIPCLIVVIMAYSKGFLAGSGTCFVVFIAFMLITIDMEGEFVSNLDQTKFMKKKDCNTSISYPCIYRQFKVDHYFKDKDNNYDYNIKIPTSLDNYAVFIPEKEMVVSRGSLFMLTTGEPPVANDYYLYDKTYDHKDVPKEFGGDNDGKDTVPKWLYNSTAPLLIFGIGGSPCLLLMLFFACRSKK